MSIPVLILGESGAGKSASLRNMDPARCGLIQPITKPLPFRAADPAAWARVTVKTDNHAKICETIHRAAAAGRQALIIDDFQYVMANEFMRRTNERGFDKFTEIACHAWDVIGAATAAAGNMRVYFMAHQETDAHGTIKVKTIGKMLDEKITLEGMFSIVLGARVTDGRHYFATRNSGRDTLKSPMGLFDSAEIDNDLAAVDAAICEYYQLTK